MQKLRIAILGLLAALLSGCVTAGPLKNADVSAIEPAILRGQANILRYYTQGEPAVDVVAIDNRTSAPFGSRTSGLEILPGRRLVTVNVIALPWNQATATVPCEFQAGKHYYLTARKAGSSFDLMFWNGSQGTGQRTLLTTSRIGARYANVAAADSATLYCGGATLAFADDASAESSISVHAIDGQLVGSLSDHPKDIHLAPGRRLVTIELRNRKSSVGATTTTEFEFGSGKTYRLTASEKKHEFDVKFWTESPEAATRALVASTQVRGWFDLPGGAFLIFLLR